MPGDDKIKYFIMVKDCDGYPCPVVDEIGMIQLFETKKKAKLHAKENCYNRYGYVIYEWKRHADR